MATANTLHVARNSGFIKGAEANATRSRGFVGKVGEFVADRVQDLLLLDRDGSMVKRLHAMY